MFFALLDFFFLSQKAIDAICQLQTGNITRNKQMHNAGTRGFADSNHMFSLDCRGDVPTSCKCQKNTFLQKPLQCDRCRSKKIKKQNPKLPFQTLLFFNCSSILQRTAVSHPFLLIFLSSPSPLLWLPAIVSCLDLRRRRSGDTLKAVATYPLKKPRRFVRRAT